MSTETNKDDRSNDELSARRTARETTSETSECPACETEVPDADLFEGECPECGASTDDLFLVAAGIKTASEVRE